MENHGDKKKVDSSPLITYSILGTVWHVLEKPRILLQNFFFLVFMLQSNLFYLKQCFPLWLPSAFIFLCLYTLWDAGLLQSVL